MEKLVSNVNTSGTHGNRVRFIGAGIFFKLALDLSYVAYLSDAFSDHFLTPFVVNFSLLQYLESFFWLVAILVFVPFTSSSAGGLVFFTAIIFLFAPMSTMFGLDYERSRTALALATITIFSAYLVSIVTFGKKVALPTVVNGQKKLLVICFVFAAFFLGLAASSGALFRMNFDLDLVYDFRAEMGQLVNQGVFVYPNLWSQKIFTPLLLAIGLHRKSFWLVVFALSMHVIYFGVTQHRAHLFAPLLVFLAHYLYRKEFSYAGGFFVAAIGLVIVNSAIFLFELYDIGALLVRRALFVGASLTYSWVDYFSENPKVYFADNLLSSFVNNDYTGVNLPLFMGDYMRFDMLVSFNSGVVGAGFAQLGVFGVALYGAILGVFIRLNDKVIESGVPPYIIAAILFLPYRIVWADSDLFTAILSHGIMVGTFAAWFYGCPENTSYYRKFLP